jgi:excisionase family DNA binding protein
LSPKEQTGLVAKNGGKNEQKLIKNMKTQIVPVPESHPQDGTVQTVLFSPNFGYGVPVQTAPVSPVSGGQNNQSSPVLTPLVYTIEEAAVVLNCSTKTIRRLIARKYLTCCTALRKKLIPRKQIESFLKATCDVPKTK